MNPKRFADRANLARNALKHDGEDPIQLAAGDEAIAMIDRAITKLRMRADLSPRMWWFVDGQVDG